MVHFESGTFTLTVAPILASSSASADPETDASFSSLSTEVAETAWRQEMVLLRGRGFKVTLTAVKGEGNDGGFNVVLVSGDDFPLERVIKQEAGAVLALIMSDLYFCVASELLYFPRVFC